MSQSTQNPTSETHMEPSTYCTFHGFSIFTHHTTEMYIAGIVWLTPLIISLMCWQIEILQKWKMTLARTYLRCLSPACVNYIYHLKPKEKLNAISIYRQHVKAQKSIYHTVHRNTEKYQEKPMIPLVWHNCQCDELGFVLNNCMVYVFTPFFAPLPLLSSLGVYGKK